MSEQKHGRWFRVDWHVHAPASMEQGSRSGEAILDILRQAEESSLDVMGLVDHNSVCSYERLRLEINRFAFLQEAGRLSVQEEATLAEYQRLLQRLLLLPGFELTTRDGVDLLALFAPEVPVERLNALLLNVGIPMDQLRQDSPEIRAEVDATAACVLISQAGGLVIATHVSPGQRTSLGEQLPGLLALEVVAPPEEVPAGQLPCLWSSQAHCRVGHGDAAGRGRLGERYTEVLADTLSFSALRELLARKESSSLRFPERARLRAYLDELCREGAERLILCGLDVDPALLYRDVAALANAGGGVVMIGLTGDEVVGVRDPETWSTELLRHTRENVNPPPQLNLELLHYAGQEVIRAEVHAPLTPPYVTREGVVYVRQGDETRPATRSELVEIAARANAGGGTGRAVDLPQAGVEIVGARLRDGLWFYDVRDLRITPGVTRQRAKGLWAYAIDRHEAVRQGRVDLSRAFWCGDHGVLRAYFSGDRRVYDLAHRDSTGRVDHVFYGVSEWGLTPRWRDVLEKLRPQLGEEIPREGPQERPPLREMELAEEPAEKARSEELSGELPPEGPSEEPPAVEPLEELAVEEEAGQPLDAPEPPEEVAAEMEGEQVGRLLVTETPIRPSPDAWGGRLPRWRNTGAVERIYWEGSHLFFDLAHRKEEDGQVRYFRRIHRNQLTGAEDWVDLIRVDLPSSGVEIVRSTASGEEILYQFRDMESGRVDPRVRRESDFSPDSPQAYAIRMFHKDKRLEEGAVRWWGNIGYLRPNEQGHLDLVFRDEQGRDHVYYAADRDRITGEWLLLLQVWEQFD